MIARREALEFVTSAAPAAARASRLSTRHRVANYASLTKPRVLTLLLLTEFAAMVMAARGWPGSWLALAGLIGGACSAGGAAAINCWFDRDIDALMARTCTRPVAAGRIEPTRAFIFGVGLSLIGFLVLAVGTNLLAAGLALGGGLFYVLVYTMWLKRSTPHN